MGVSPNAPLVLCSPAESGKTLVAFRSPRPSRQVVLFGSVLISRIAVYVPVCSVVWEGRSVMGVPIPIAYAHFISRNLRQNLQWQQGVLQQSFYDEV